MLTTESDSIIRILRWQRRNIAKFTLLSVSVVAIEELSGGFLRGRVPDVPVGVLGAAISIYVGFRTNSAFDRWWEGRKLWGQLVNSCRHFAAQTLAYLPDAETLQRELVLRMAQYVHTLRCELRREPAAEDEDVLRVTNEASVELPDRSSSPATHQLRSMLELLAGRAKHLDERRLQSLDRTLATLLDVQGGCERIKNTPLPPAYGFIAEVLIRVLAVLLPLALVDDLHWLAIPVSIAICLAFKLINEVGRVLEDPFTTDWEALPLHAISRTIERNLRDALGDARPSNVGPDHRGVLL